MNLPFGLPVVREVTVKKRNDLTQVAALYERKLAEYKDSLEYYRKCVLEYASKLDNYDRRSMDNKMAIIESALDVTYLKEQGERTLTLIEELKSNSVNKALIGLDKLTIALADVNYKLENIDKVIEQLDKTMGILDKKVDNLAADVEGLDKNVVNRLSELLIQLQKQMVYQNDQLHAELLSGIEKVNKSVKGGHTLLWIIFILNFMGVSTAVIFVLYYLEIIPFW